MKGLKLFLPLLLLWLSGCANTIETAEQKPPQYWPEPPALPRFVHEFTLRNSLDIHRYSEDETILKLLNGKDPDGYRLFKPFALAAQQGRIYISDTAINLIHVFDVPRRRYFRMGYRLEGQLKDPRGITLDELGRVYVVDSGSRRIVKYDAAGLFISAIELEEDVSKPTGIAVSADGQQIYLVDTGGVDSDAHRIIQYSADGRRLAVIGTRGSEPGQFNLPVDVALDGNGLLYVLDAGNFRVQVFDQGRFVRSWGKVGNGLGRLARPRSIETDGDGNIYISDSQFTNVQIFNPRGQLLLPIGKQAFDDIDGHLTLIAGITVDETGRLYVIDQKQRKVEIYRPIHSREGARILERYSQPNSKKL
ncbi:MAG: hypothetical protein V7752_04365 [Halopseudomonas sp.]